MSSDEIETRVNEWREQNQKLIANSEHLGVLKERLRIAEILEKYGKTNWIDQETYKMMMEDLLGQNELD